MSPNLNGVKFALHVAKRKLHVGAPSWIFGDMIFGNGNFFGEIFLVTSEGGLPSVHPPDSTTVTELFPGGRIFGLVMPPMTIVRISSPVGKMCPPLFFPNKNSDKPLISLSLFGVGY